MKLDRKSLICLKFSGALRGVLVGSSPADVSFVGVLFEISIVCLFFVPFLFCFWFLFCWAWIGFFLESLILAQDERWRRA